MDKFQCMLCGSSYGQLVKSHTRDSEHEVLKCLDCGLEQLYPLPGVLEDEEYYNINSHDKGITPSFTIEDLFKKFEFQNLTRVKYLEEYGIKKEWKMLDCGSGYGFFIEIMKGKGYEFDGLEISEDRLSVCEKRLGSYFRNIRNINLLAETVPEDLKEKYHLITMFHLLEHITNPRKFLDRVVQLLKPEGVLVIEVPNVDNLMMEASEEFNNFFYIRDHVAYYTPQLLKRLVEEAGLKVRRLRGNQIYGLTNHMNWIINGRPELEKPSYESCEPMRWIEDIYKERLDDLIKSEYMYIIAEKC